MSLIYIQIGFDYYLKVKIDKIDFYFGPYILRVHPNKSQLKICGRKKHGHTQGLSKVCKYPPLSQEREKLPTSNFVRVRTFIQSIATKGH